MSASLTTLALAAGAAFGSVVFIPPWLLYVKVVNDSVRKAEALLTKRRSVLLAEHEEIRQELMAIRPEEISTTLAYEEPLKKRSSAKHTQISSPKKKVSPTGRETGSS